VQRLPFGLRDKVDEKLDDLRDVEIIGEVPQTTPTTWVSPLVVFPKADGKDIHVCLNMRRANEAIVRERHTIPTIEEVLPWSDAERQCSVRLILSGGSIRSNWRRAQGVLEPS